MKQGRTWVRGFEELSCPKSFLSTCPNFGEVHEELPPNRVKARENNSGGPSRPIHAPALEPTVKKWTSSSCWRWQIRDVEDENKHRSLQATQFNCQNPAQGLRVPAAILRRLRLQALHPAASPVV